MNTFLQMKTPPQSTLARRRHLQAPSLHLDTNDREWRSGQKHLRLICSIVGEYVWKRFKGDEKQEEPIQESSNL
jgi:hypothetical protein